jgi:hypothetical protein
VKIRAEGRQGLAAGGMEMARVVLEAVVGRKVHAAAEPPDVAGGKEAHVHVHRGAIRVARVQDQRHAHRFERASGELRPRGARRRRQVASVHARQVDAAAFKYLPVLDDAGRAAAALRALPRIANEAFAVDDFQRGDDAFLQVG